MCGTFVGSNVKINGKGIHLAKRISGSYCLKKYTHVEYKNKTRTISKINISI